MARRMGIASSIAPYPSSAIGASVVQPLDMIASYTTFSNLGTPVEPRFIYRIEDRTGKTIHSVAVRALPPALDQRATYVVRDMMRDVVERGTASSIRRYLPPSVPVAGKTGTTNDNTDVWFIGLTPDLVAGVWLGFDKPKTITPGAAGGTLAAPIWGKMMSRYYAATRAPSNTWSSPPLGVIPGELDRVTRSGAISRVIDISASQGHVVPTALTYHRGIYIANLGLFEPTDRAGDEHVWRLTGHRTLKVRATGVEKVLGLAFRGGKLYALEMSTTAGAPTPGTGAIVRVNRHGPPETVVSGLTFPTGMTVGPDGAFYVSNQGFGFGPGQGQILRIQA